MDSVIGLLIPGMSMNQRVHRPLILNPDGGFSSEITHTVTNPRLYGGKPTVIPTVVNGKVVSEPDAIRHAITSGEHFGVYNSIPASDRDIERTHAELERRMGPIAARGWQEALGTDAERTAEIRDQLWRQSQRKKKR